MSNGAILSHATTSLVTRDQLRAIPAPVATETFKPVPHIELIETLEIILKVRGILIRRKEDGSLSEQFAIRADGSRLFGTMDLTLNGVPDTCAALGFRQANDRSMALQMVAGLRVFVCDNLCLNGDFVALERRHTSGLNLIDELTLAVAKFELHYVSLKTEVENLKAKELTDVEAKATIHDIFMSGVLPVRLFPVVSKEYFEPRHAEFEPRNLWSLHNAITEAVKPMPLTTRLIATQQVGKLFGFQAKN
jgi:hypothetical protein